MLSYPKSHGQSVHLPMVVELGTVHHGIASFAEFGSLQQLLTTKYSLVNPTRAESGTDELDILCRVARRPMDRCRLKCSELF